MMRSDRRRFAHRLALATGHLHVKEMLRKMSAKEFNEWVIYNQCDPFGDERLDWLFAGIRQMIFNMAVDSKDRLPIGEFKLNFSGEEKKKPKKTADQMLALAHLIVAQQNALVEAELQRNSS